MVKCCQKAEKTGEVRKFPFFYHLLGFFNPRSRRNRGVGLVVKEGALAWAVASQALGLRTQVARHRGGAIPPPPPKVPKTPRTSLTRGGGGVWWGPNQALSQPVPKSAKPNNTCSD